MVLPSVSSWGPAEEESTMSGSETGLIATRGDPIPVALQKSSNPFATVHNMRLPFAPSGAGMDKPVMPNFPPYEHPGSTGNGGLGGSLVAGMMLEGMPHQGINMNMSVNVNVEPKKRRGRPRKYGTDGTISFGRSPAMDTGFSPSNTVGGSGSSEVAADGLAGGSVRKSRGRPRGSKNKKKFFEVSGSGGLGFTPHVITVKAGEDVCSTMMSFSQHGTRDVCILSANGAISNATLRRPAISGGTATYDGQFEILSLSGSFLESENGGQRGRTGGLSVSLAGPDGHVLGGVVAGPLTAASPVQVIAGSFFAECQTEPKAVNPTDHFIPPAKVLPISSAQIGMGGGGSSPSHGTMSESSGEDGSPLNQSTAPQVIPTMLWK